MFKRLYYFVVGIVALGMMISVTQAQELDINKIKEQLPKLLGANNQGTEFVFGFHPAWEESGSNNGLYLYISSAVQTQVRVYIPYFGSDPYMVQTTIPNDIIVFRLPPSVGQPYERTDAMGLVSGLLPTQVWKGRGIIVTADAPIICYGVTRYQYTSDGFLALPSHALGKEYMISSYTETCDLTMQSLTPYADIIGVYDNTKVNFSIGGNNGTRVIDLNGKKWVPSQIMSAVLNRGDFWLVAAQAAYSDLGGSYVKANKPVSVLSGNHCAYIPQSVAACDFISEVEPPIMTWGKKLYITPIYGRKNGSVCRFFAKEANTTFSRDGVPFAQLFSTWGVQDEGWLEKRSDPEGGSNKPAVITADKPINVVQYNPGINDDGVSSDPFQMMLTPYEQFMNEIIFNTPGIRGGFGFDVNYINIVYKSDSTGQIPDDLLIGEVNTAHQTVWTKLKDKSSAPGQQFNDPDLIGQKEQFFAKTYQLPYDGVYRLKCTSQKITAYLYGFSWCDSYGMATSVALADLSKPDTVAPVPYYHIYCDGSTIDKNGKNSAGVIDMPDDDSVRSNMSLILFDRNNSYNYIFSNDDFIPGEDRTVKWSLKTINPSQDAHAVITFADRAGNDTTIVIDYWAIKLSITPSTVYYGNLKIGDQVTKTFVIKNESKTSPAYLQEVSLQTFRESLASQGFKLNYSFDINQPLLPQDTRTFTITFTAPSEGEFKDSVGVGDTCFYQYKALVRASVGTPIIEVSDVDFGKKTVGIQTTPLIATITNNGTTSLAITGYTNNTLSVFTNDLPTITPENPLIIDKGGQYQFQVFFKPDAVKQYLDSIVFQSDAGTNIDNVCMIQGEGIQPQLQATGDDWGRRRAHLAKYDTYPYYKFTPYPAPTGAIVLSNPGSKEVTINKIDILQDVQGEAFEINVDGTLQPLKNYINNIGQIKDISGQTITVIPAGGSRTVPVFFHPRAEGQYTLEIQYESDAVDSVTSTLTGIGIYPKITTTDVDFGTKVIGEAPVSRTVRFANETWDYQDSLVLQGLDIQPNGSISPVLATPGTEGFSYDSQHIALGFTGMAQFPVTLKPGDFIEITGNFAAVKTGNAAGNMTSISDADVDATSHWTGFGIAESLILNPGNEPFLCYNTFEDITYTLVNNGSSDITIPANSVNILNDADNSFSLISVTRANGSTIDFTQNFTIAKGETLTITVRFSPATKTNNNTEELHQATLQVKTLAVTPELQTLQVPVKGRAIHYTRTSEAKINGENQVIVNPGQDVSKQPISYSIYITQGAQLDLANPTEFTVTIQYEKNFLAIRNDNNNKYMISVGSDLPAGWIVKDYNLALDKTTNVETVTIHLTGSTPFKSSTRSQIVKIEFLSFLPWTSDNGQMVVKGKTVQITHSIITNDQCVDVIDPVPVKATLTETCMDPVRQIVISASDYHLGEVNPNPVGATGTDIPFSIAFDGYVEIRIVNAGGEVVNTPIAQNMKAGSYSVRIPADLPNGAYFLEMTSGEYKQLRKFTVAK